jgi:hypothetical protein
MLSLTKRHMAAAAVAITRQSRMNCFRFLPLISTFDLSLDFRFLFIELGLCPLLGRTVDSQFGGNITGSSQYSSQSKQKFCCANESTMRKRQWVPARRTDYRAIAATGTGQGILSVPCLTSFDLFLFLILGASVERTLGPLGQLDLS